MGFYYSEKLGLYESKHLPHDTPEEAYAEYYLDRKRKINESIRITQMKEKKYNKELANLEETFANYKEKSPELYI